MNENKQYKALLQERAELVAEGEKLFAAAEAAGRELSAEEKQRDDAINARLAEIAGDVKRHEARLERQRTVAAAPAHIKQRRPDTWADAFATWAKTGDGGALRELGGGEVEGGMEGVTISAASNATDMNIGTAADGGDTVAVGFYNQIIAKRDESLLRDRLGVRMIPGQGTTVDVPVDNEADGEFITKAEANDYDQDAPALTKKSLTLVKYTKYTDVSDELMQDTAVNLMAFLADFVGRGMAKTHNNLLLTEVAANGTSLKTFTGLTVAFGEPEDMVANDDLAAYLDDDRSVAWVMRSSTHWNIKSLVSDSLRQYAVFQGGSARELLGYPVLYSQKAAAEGASAKSVYFGNWSYVGCRDGAGLTFIRDPYTVALKGQTRLLWNFRTDYAVLQAEAVGYGVHPTG